MIRTLAPDELTWFLSQSLRFLQHSDPQGLALRFNKHIHDKEAEADTSFVLIEHEPLAGVHVIAPQQDDDDQNLYLSHVWYSQAEADLERLLRHVFARHHYEAVHFPLFNFSEMHMGSVKNVFEKLGFALEGACDLDFDLAELPPLGTPLILEAWDLGADDAFQTFFEVAEAKKVSDDYWAWLKRWRGKFSPDYWFITRETLDQDPVGYIFFGAHSQGIDGLYYLTAAGVLPEHRHSSEMLRRVVLSGLHELASLAPLGQVETTIATDDPKLIRIFESLGFDTYSRYKRFIKRPK